MEKEKTLYEKAIEKEKEIEIIIKAIRAGEHKMYDLSEEPRNEFSAIFGEAFPYMRRAIRRELRHEIANRAVELAKAELKTARQAAADEARKILADCEKNEESKKDIPVESKNQKTVRYNKLRCKTCGAYISNLSKVEMVTSLANPTLNSLAAFWECTKCGERYFNQNDISYNIVEIH